MWFLHELAKETDQITEVGSSDREIDEASNKLSILSRLTLYGAGVVIQFEVSSRGVATYLHSIISNLYNKLRM